MLSNRFYFDFVDDVLDDYLSFQKENCTIYVDTKSSIFELIKPKGIGIGFDKLPPELLNSKLTGNQLAKMASLFKIPKLKEKIGLSRNKII